MKKASWKKPSSSYNPEESPGLLLWQVSNQWRRQIEASLAPLGITHTQYILLSTINWLTSDGTDITQGQIARHASLDITMTSQIIRALERKGFIERRVRLGDDRSKFPHLTKFGAEVLEQAIPVVEEIDGNFFSPLKSDAQRCINLIQKLNY